MHYLYLNCIYRNADGLANVPFYHSVNLRICLRILYLNSLSWLMFPSSLGGVFRGDDDVDDDDDNHDHDDDDLRFPIYDLRALPANVEYTSADTNRQGPQAELTIDPLGKPVSPAAGQPMPGRGGWPAARRAMTDCPAFARIPEQGCASCLSTSVP